MRSEDVCGMKREGSKAAREKAPRFRPRCLFIIYRSLGALIRLICLRTESFLVLYDSHNNIRPCKVEDPIPVYDYWLPNEENGISLYLHISYVIYSLP